MHVSSGVPCLPGLGGMGAHDLEPVLAAGGAHGGGCQPVPPAPLGPPRPNPHTPCTNQPLIRHSPMSYTVVSS